MIGKMAIRLCHTAAILSRETKKALFYHAEPCSQNSGGEAVRGKTELFWSPWTIWLPCDKGESLQLCMDLTILDIRWPLLFFPDTDFIYKDLHIVQKLTKTERGKSKKCQDFCPRDIEFCHIVTARCVKLWSLNSNLFFKESHQLIKFS